jgi:hypothetical protein
MRQKIAFGAGLVVVAQAVTVLVCNLIPTEPPLRVGMSDMEVRKALDAPEPLTVPGAANDTFAAAHAYNGA